MECILTTLPGFTIPLYGCQALGFTMQDRLKQSLHLRRRKFSDTRARIGYYVYGHQTFTLRESISLVGLPRHRGEVDRTVGLSTGGG